MSVDGVVSTRERAGVAACQASVPVAAERTPMPGAFRTPLDMEGISPNRRHERLQSVLTGSAFWTALRTAEVNQTDVIEDVRERTGADGDPS